MTFDDMRAELAQQGSTVFHDKAGRRVMLVSGRVLSFAADTDLLIAYEGEGAFLWDTGTKINTFRLIEAGFGLTSAPTLVEVCKGLIAQENCVEAVRPSLEAPRG